MTWHSRLISWRESPATMVREEFDATPDPFQERALSAFARSDMPRLRISLQACAGPGKSAVLAWMLLNFMACYGRKGQHPKCAAVSITGQNLRDNLWSELSKWQKRSAFFTAAFEWRMERFFAKDHPETWWASARQFARKADAQEQGRTLSGLHAEDILIILDESGEIPVSVLKAAEQALAVCRWGRIVQAGNPTSLSGALYEASRSPDRWVIIPISGDPEDPQRSSRVDKEWAAGEIAKYGREDPWVQAYILGQFPPGGLNTLISLEDVEACEDRHLQEDAYSGSQKRIGVDVARFGDDRTVIVARQGLWLPDYVEMRGARSDEIAARVIVAKNRFGSEAEYVDATGGWGSGVVDSLIRAGHRPFEVNFSGHADDRRFANKRAEMWFRMRDWLLRGASFPKIPGFAEELCAATYGFPGGRIQLEDKDRIKLRIKRSPDMADSVSTTFAHDEMPGSATGVRRKVKVESNWNPLERRS